MKRNDFDLISLVYDRLATLIFMGRIKKSHIQWLDMIPEGASVLVAGGGTGKFLRYLRHRNCSFVYLELSQKMIEEARTNTEGLNIEFVTKDFLDFNNKNTFDAIIAFYFLDVFTENDLEIVLSKIDSILKEGGKLFVSDFQNENNAVWKNIFLSLMYSFFKIFTRLDSGKLLPFRKKIVNKGFTETRYKPFFGSFIFSSVFLKN